MKNDFNFPADRDQDDWRPCQSGVLRRYSYQKRKEKVDLNRRKSMIQIAAGTATMVAGAVGLFWLGRRSMMGAPINSQLAQVPTDQGANNRSPNQNQSPIDQIAESSPPPTQLQDVPNQPVVERRVADERIAKTSPPAGPQQVNVPNNDVANSKRFKKHTGMRTSVTCRTFVSSLSAFMRDEIADQPFRKDLANHLSYCKSCQQKFTRMGGDMSDV